MRATLSDLHVKVEDTITEGARSATYIGAPGSL
jgi:hypothetical protein